MNDYFMEIAVKEAYKGMKRNDGGPFGAVIVQNGRVLTRTHNMVIRTNDPTAHAEIVAIRNASKKLSRFDLSDCEIYSTCEPCPMCLAGIHWARIGRLYYGCAREDASMIGFDDKLIYDVLSGVSESQQFRSTQMGRELCIKLFDEWMLKEDRVQY